MQSLNLLKRADTDTVKDPLFRYFEREVTKYFICNSLIELVIVR